MKHLGIIGLVAAFMMQVMSTSLLVLNYEVNTSYIIENFCVNTDRPEMHCDGKCHLSKQIAAESEQKSETPAAEIELLSLVLTAAETPADFRMYGVGRIAPSSLYLEGTYTLHLQGIFHPPQV